MFLPFKESRVGKRLIKSQKGIKEFSYCILITLVFWVSMTTSEDYEYTLSYPLHVELRNDKNVLIKQSVFNVDILFQSNGMEALLRKNSRKQKKLSLTINSVDFNTQSDVYLLNLQSNRNEILSQFKALNTQRTTILGNTLRIPLDNIAQKKVKVDISDVRYNFASQHGLYGNIVLFPDSVTIEGEASVVGKQNSIKTKPYTFDNIHTSKVYFLNFNARTNPPFVALYIPTNEYTEHTLSVPVKVISDNPDIEIKVYPEAVNITTFVALNDYDKVKAELFSPVVRFSDTTSGKLPVSISQFPSFVRIQKISPKEVQYVIVK